MSLHLLHSKLDLQHFKLILIYCKRKLKTKIEGTGSLMLPNADYKLKPLICIIFCINEVTLSINKTNPVHSPTLLSDFYIYVANS